MLNIGSGKRNAEMFLSGIMKSDATDSGQMELSWSDVIDSGRMQLSWSDVTDSSGTQLLT